MDKKVQETLNLWETYRNKRDPWARHAQEDKEFRLGKQWSKEQSDILKSRGQAPIVVNRIHPAVESAKAMITSNRPSFRVSPREDSDNQIAQAMNGLLEYVWQISDGEAVMRRVVDDYYVTGMGVALVYQDPMSDLGKGDVKIKDIDPLDVYIDPNSRDPFCSDAENIIISRLFSKDQAKKHEPMFKRDIENAESDQISDRPVTDRVGNLGLVFPEETSTRTDVSFGKADEYIRGYERYQKIIEKRYSVYEGYNGSEDILDDAQFSKYIKEPVWLINGQLIADPTRAQNMIKQLQLQFQQQMQQLQQLQMAVEQGQADPQMLQQAQQQIQEPQIEQKVKAELIKEGIIETIKVPVWRIKMTVIMGETKLYERILPIDTYPIITFMNIHTRTPYPVSDVRMVKDLQEYINKTRSLIIAHATTSTNTKILVPEGSVDMKEFEKKWAQPGVAIPYDPTDGMPIPVQPLALPNELYKNEADAKNDIDHELGLYELMMGSSAAAPQTYKATISIDEFGQRKIRSKLADIESGLRKLAQVAIPLIQQLYTSEKVIRLIQPSSEVSEYMINKRMYDDKGNVIETLNKVSTGKYDVVIVTGSTLPTNRYAQLEMYMDSYEKGIIDRTEVLKKTEVFDMEGVLRRTDAIDQLKQQVEQLTEENKNLKGDAQTRDRENIHLKQKVEIEKFKTDLNSTSEKARAAGTVYGQRLSDARRQVDSELRNIKQNNKKNTKE